MSNLQSGNAGYMGSSSNHRGTQHFLWDAPYQWHLFGNTPEILSKVSAAQTQQPGPLKAVRKVSIAALRVA